MGAIERLVIELGRLHEAAGGPSLRQVVNAVKRQAPATRLGVATLQNWLKGTAVPSDPKTFALVIGVLEAFASRRHRAGPPPSLQGGYQPRGAAYWEALRKACADERRAARAASRPRKTDPDRPLAAVAPGGSAVPDGLETAPPPAPVVENSPENSTVVQNGTAPAAVPSTGRRHRKIWVSAGAPLVVCLLVLVWTQMTHMAKPRTVHVEIPPTAIQLPATLDPATFLPDDSNAIVNNCKRKRGHTRAYRSIPVRKDGADLGTFSLLGNPWGGCGVAWAEYLTGPANRPFVDLQIQSITMSFRRVAPIPVTTAQDELWNDQLPANAGWRDIWTDALRIKRGAAFAAELTLVMAA